MIKRFQTKLFFILGVILLINIMAVIVWNHFESYKITLVSCLIFITILIIAIFLFYWISVPISLLTKSFRLEDPSIIEPLRNDKTEIGKLAALVLEFFDQKKKLEAEIQDRIIAEKRVKEFSEQLENKVIERTRELTESNTLLRSEIEERKKVEESLHELQSRLQFLAETTCDVLYRLKYDSMKYDYVNPAIQILTGYSQEEINEIGFAKIILKKELHDLPHNNNYLDLTNFDIQRFITEYTADYLILRKDGQTIWVGDHSYPWKDKDGKVIGSVGVLQDITKRKISEMELVKAKERAEKSDQLKTDFLTQMSHEIRTPLNTILNYTSLIRDEIEIKSFEALPLFFDVISQAGRRLIRTIDLILNMSQIQTGSYEPNIRTINLEKDVLNQIINEYCSIAEKKGIKLNYRNEANASVIEGDNYTVTQILDNIIDNAVKYTAAGNVDVLVYSQNGSVCIDIKDTGIGIQKEYLPSLFSPFSQEEMGYSRRFDGNGLGLALVKKYIELNNAKISVVSEKGKGSLFTVKFNRAANSNPDFN